MKCTKLIFLSFLLGLSQGLTAMEGHDQNDVLGLSQKEIDNIDTKNAYDSIKQKIRRERKRQTKEHRSNNNSAIKSPETPRYNRNKQIDLAKETNGNMGKTPSSNTPIPFYEDEKVAELLAEKEFRDVMKEMSTSSTKAHETKENLLKELEEAVQPIDENNGGERTTLKEQILENDGHLDTLQREIDRVLGAPVVNNDSNSSRDEEIIKRFRISELSDEIEQDSTKQEVDASQQVDDATNNQKYAEDSIASQKLFNDIEKRANEQEDTLLKAKIEDVRQLHKNAHFEKQKKEFYYDKIRNQEDNNRRTSNKSLNNELRSARRNKIVNNKRGLGRHEECAVQKAIDKDLKDIESVEQRLAEQDADDLDYEALLEDNDSDLKELDNIQKRVDEHYYEVKSKALNAAENINSKRIQEIDQRSEEIQERKKELDRREKEINAQLNQKKEAETNREELQKLKETVSKFPSKNLIIDDAEDANSDSVQQDTNAQANNAAQQNKNNGWFGWLAKKTKEIIAATSNKIAQTAQTATDKVTSSLFDVDENAFTKLGISQPEIPQQLNNNFSTQVALPSESLKVPKKRRKIVPVTPAQKQEVVQAQGLDNGVGILPLISEKSVYEPIYENNNETRQNLQVSHKRKKVAENMQTSEDKTNDRQLVTKVNDKIIDMEFVADSDEDETNEYYENDRSHFHINLPLLPKVAQIKKPKWARMVGISALGLGIKAATYSAPAYAVKKVQTLWQWLKQMAPAATAESQNLPINSEVGNQADTVSNLLILPYEKDNALEENKPRKKVSFDKKMRIRTFDKDAPVRPNGVKSSFITLPKILVGAGITAAAIAISYKLYQYFKSVEKPEVSKQQVGADKLPVVDNQEKSIQAVEQLLMHAQIAQLEKIELDKKLYTEKIKPELKPLSADAQKIIDVLVEDNDSAQLVTYLQHTDEPVINKAFERFIPMVM